MKLRVKIESSDLRENQASVRLVPVDDNVESDNVQVWNTSVQGNSAVMVFLTNPSVFGDFVPGRRAYVTITFDDPSATPQTVTNSQ